MAQGRISKKAINLLACQAGKDREFLWDDDLAGFGVAAFASGKKVYYAQYRKDGRSRRIAIGEHGRLTPDEARSKAKQILGAVEGGDDPIEERRAARAVRVFREVAAEFLVLHVSAKRKGRTYAEYDRLIRVHLLPVFGARRMVDIKRADVARFHSSLADRPYAANRSVAVLSSIWNWASRHDEVAFGDNPVRSIDKNPESGRERFLTTEEFGRLGEALRLAETEGLQWCVDEKKPGAKHLVSEDKRRTVLDPFAVAAVRLLMFTGARLREILTARWEHVDFERGIIHLPDSKTGKKPIYLSAPSLEVLASLPRIDGNPHVIPGAKQGAPRSDLKKPWIGLTRAANLPGLRIHDLRHSFASFGAGASMGLPIIGKLLGHSQPATTARYAHLDADPVRRASEAIGRTIAAALNAKPDNNVVRIKGGR
jgi:integrase